VQDNILTRQWWRVGGYFGIAFIVLFIVAVVVQEVLAGGPPAYDEPVEEIRTFWEEEGQGFLIGDYLFSLTYLLFFLPFIVGLRALLGRAEGGGQIFSRVTMLAGILALALLGAGTATWTTLAFGAENLADDFVVGLMYMNAAAWSLTSMPLGVLLLAASVVIFTTGVLWRWLAIFGAIVGILAIVAPLSILDDDPEGPLAFVGFIAFLGLAIWVLATSIGMILRKVEPVHTVSPATEEPRA
jgi:hypothetical protein